MCDDNKTVKHCTPIDGPWDYHNHLMILDNEFYSCKCVDPRYLKCEEGDLLVVDVGSATNKGLELNIHRRDEK